jgi:hypothetical protein
MVNTCNSAASCYKQEKFRSVCLQERQYVQNLHRDQVHRYRATMREISSDVEYPMQPRVKQYHVNHGNLHTSCHSHTQGRRKSYVRLVCQLELLGAPGDISP